MPYLEIRFKGNTVNTKCLGELGTIGEEAFANMQNSLLGTSLEPKDILVRFIEASEWDRNIPDVCFILRCGASALTKEERIELCEEFWVAVTKKFGNTKILSLNQGSPLSFDIELFDESSNGFRETGSKREFSWQSFF